MAIAGTWRANQSSPVAYTTRLKQGTGINPIHEIPGGEGRNIAPDGVVVGVPDEFTAEEFGDVGFAGYTDEDSSSTLWGYGTETGTSLRPSLDASDAQFRAAVTNQNGVRWPSWGRRRNNGRLTGIPGGTVIRSVDNGAEATFTAKTDFDKSQFADAENKAHNATPENAQVSDPSQYEIQTSMVQRDKTRTGSQTPTGRANEYDAPIGPRVPGQRHPTISAGYRLGEMLPKSQDVIIRPFWNRTAGTGPQKWMRVNSLYESDPLTRVPPDDPYSGREVDGNTAGYVPGDHIHGYTDEDVVW